jgi:pimeloyl-ACP methyl ester carboxylesterase
VAPRIEDSAPSFWRTYVDNAVETLTDLATDSVVLVPHSGAGALVAAIADMCVPEIAGIVFVDAVLPADGKSRLQTFEEEDASFASLVRTDLEAGGRFPDWSDAILAPLVPDAGRRRALLEEVQPRALDFFIERIPAPAWPRPRCAYLHLSSSYDRYTDVGEAEGWPTTRRPLGHFGALVAPDVVARDIVPLVETLQP